MIKKIWNLFDKICEYIGFHYVGYKVYIYCNIKEIKALDKRIKLLESLAFNGDDEGVKEEHK